MSDDLNDRARQRAEQEARIRAMQAEQVTVEGAAPKGRVDVVSAYLVTAIAMILPLKVRTAFSFALNFIYNRVGATLRLVAAWIARALAQVAMFLVYHLVLGPTALLMRWFGSDDLRPALKDGSYFTDKDPADEGEARFSRQY